MIDALLSILKPIDAPGSIPFLLLAIAAGLVMSFVWPRNRRLGRRWFAALAALYLTLALPVVARTISGSLPQVPTSDARALGPLDALVVFDGDNRRGRVSATRDVFFASHPPVVWVLGLEADWIRDNLPDAGIPAGIIRTDFSTGTTRAQLSWVTDYRARDSHARLAIVASRLQVARIAGVVKAASLAVPIVSAPVDVEPASRGLRLLVPTYFALRVSRDALYEHAAIMYYRSRGWAHE